MAGALGLGLVAGLAVAQEMPARKAGLWNLDMQMQGMPMQIKSQQCVDAKTDADMQRKAMSGDPNMSCAQKSIKRSGNAVDIEAECSARDGGKVFVHAHAAGDFGKSYTVESKARFEPPRHGMKDATMKVTATHAGDCPAGMQPGQVRTLGGPGGPGGAGGPGGPGGRPAGMPMDPKALQGMSPEQLRQMAEEMKKAAGR